MRTRGGGHACPRSVHALEVCAWGCAYPEGHMCQACPPLDRMTDACENITLPQNSFAGGNEQNFLDYLMCGHLNVLIKIFQNLLEIISMTSQTEKTSASIGPRKRSVLKFRYIFRDMSSYWFNKKH